jgi:hypothetical protein
MSKSLKFVTVVSFAVCLLMGCKTAPQKTEAIPPQTNTAPAQAKAASPQTTVQVIMEGSPETQAALFKLAQQDPTIIDPQSGTNYFITPIKPKSGTKYKIVQVKSDPNIDYKGIIAGPKSQIELLKFREQIRDAIKEQVQEQNRRNP